MEEHRLIVSLSTLSVFLSDSSAVTIDIVLPPDAYMSECTAHVSAPVHWA